MDNLKVLVVIVFSFLLVSTFSSCAALSEFGIDVDGLLARTECNSKDCWTYQEDEDAEIKTQQEQQMAEDRVNTAIQLKDIVLGMSKMQVRKSWGEPVRKEFADRGGFGNERWIYGGRYSLSGERVIVFERGVVVGWQR